MDFLTDKRIILLLDAGGTNFVFTAIQYGKEIVEPIRKPANGDNLELCLSTIADGFKEVINQLTEAPSAISFAFPGPADYPMGIIGDLKNLPGFRGGVPLASILEEQFKIPVYINNDGDLYAYGEALSGILPEINSELKKAGSKKQYNNLVGLTLGTGFGAGIVRNNELFIGDNAMAGEVWILSNRHDPTSFAENNICAKAIVRKYSEHEKDNSLMPKDIYDIAKGKKEGDAAKAKFSFEEFGKNLGDVIGNLIALFDGIIVIGGGIAAAANLYMPALFKELNGKFIAEGQEFARIVQRTYNYDDNTDKQVFLKDYSKEVTVPTTNKKIYYDPVSRVAIATSKLGASKAIAMGAYAYALKQLNR